MSNPISGRVHVTLGGIRRELVCDMTAAAVLFQVPEIGAHWPLWVIERFVGIPQRVDGKTVRKLPPLDPADLAIAVYAFLATDRARNQRDETVLDVQSSVGIGQIANLQSLCTQAAIASLGVPGEGHEVVTSA